MQERPTARMVAVGLSGPDSGGWALTHVVLQDSATLAGDAATRRQTASGGERS